MTINDMFFLCLLGMAIFMIAGTLLDSLAFWGIAVGLAFWSGVLYVVIPQV